MILVCCTLLLLHLLCPLTDDHLFLLLGNGQLHSLPAHLVLLLGDEADAPSRPRRLQVLLNEVEAARPELRPQRRQRVLLALLAPRLVSL